MPFTNYAINKILNYYFGSTSGSPPATYYFGLSTTTISSSGSNITEPTSGSYARAAAVNDKTFWNTSTTQAIKNSASLSFPQAYAAWGTVLAVFASDAPTSGSVWWYYNLPTGVAAQNMATLSFSASAINVTLT